MKKIRTLIVDDEALARARLWQLLQNEAEVEIVGECAHGREAVEVIEKKLPELVFLGFSTMDKQPRLPAPCKPAGQSLIKAD